MNLLMIEESTELLFSLIFWYNNSVLYTRMQTLSCIHANARYAPQLPHIWISPFSILQFCLPWNSMGYTAMLHGNRSRPLQ